MKNEDHKKSDEEDKTLVALIQTSDELAFSKLYTKYQGIKYKFYSRFAKYKDTLGEGWVEDQFNKRANDLWKKVYISIKNREYDESKGTVFGWIYKYFDKSLWPPKLTPDEKRIVKGEIDEERCEYSTINPSEDNPEKRHLRDEAERCIIENMKKLVGSQWFRENVADKSNYYTVLSHLCSRNKVFTMIQDFLKICGVIILQNLTAREIAEVFDISYDNVRKIQQRLIEAIFKKLKKTKEKEDLLWILRNCT